MRGAIVSSFLTIFVLLLRSTAAAEEKTCRLRPLGHGKDDTSQVEKAIANCGKHGTTIFETGSYNITRKMKWDLLSSKVDLKGYLNFPPNIDYWLNPNNTYRAIIIQSQASWFVVTGRDFVIDAHNTGGIQGNGQKWWSFYAGKPHNDGDGRPVSLSLVNVTRGEVRNFRIESPPFWANAVSQSSQVTYDGMYTNASSLDPAWEGQNLVLNTDGINTYRSSFVTLKNWDVTCGDDCLAIKGNSSNIVAHNITCRGGNGIAFGSLGQYAELVDIVENVDLKDIHVTRIDPKIQPLMQWGVMFKSWSGSVKGAPPTGGGGGTGYARNITARNVYVDRVDTPIYIHQTYNNDEHSGDLPSKLNFGGITYINFTGTASSDKIVDLQCSPGAFCHDITFKNINVTAPAGVAPQYLCLNTQNIHGLSGEHELGDTCMIVV
ncbi:pectin lyase fold/virulence factor [Crepidotus variabilis]|uniref:galacturonan 1,4-alpha-galacturonidase n=1 Tax=Crepidotus variabilis TaxID=179855 RepID=A0A9P6JI18_9AGAR|nr:pectin lyase fold/virulence factor [Crepidotus variabilis]